MTRAGAVLVVMILAACSGAPGGGHAPDRSSDARAGDDVVARAGGERATSRASPAVDAAPRATVAVVGDMGTGESAQRDVAAALCRMHDDARFELVATTGDNIYPSGSRSDFRDKFFRPYRCLFNRDVRFRASFGNHDVRTDGGRGMLDTRAFGMKSRYYSFAAGPARFIVIDSTNLNTDQLTWLDRKLVAAEGARWLVVVLHHPPYSGGGEHGSDLAVRAALEPRFVSAGVDLVLSGHDHVYSRGESRGVHYVVTGGGGAGLYPCSAEPPREVLQCRSVHHFVLVRISESALIVRAVRVDGRTIDRVRIVPDGP